MNTTNPSQQLISQEKYNSLLEEQAKLIKEAVDITEDLNEAWEDDDWRENHSLDVARHKQKLNEKRRYEIEILLKNSKIIEKDLTQNSTSIKIGSTVTLLFNSKHLIYTLVSEAESDPLNNRISISSPFGQELLGKNTGDIFIFKDRQYEIIIVS